MPSPNAIAPPPSTARSQLSTVNSRLLCSNSFRFTHFRENASASPLESHTFKTKDLKCPVFTHFQKKGGGHPTVKSEEGRRTRRTQRRQSGHEFLAGHLWPGARRRTPKGTRRLRLRRGTAV